MIFTNKRILFVGAHPDDIEFGCGGLISNLMALGCSDIRCVVLSTELRSSDGFVQAVRDLDEQRAAFGALGLHPSNYSITPVAPGQLFPEYRQNILEALYEEKAQFQPQIVFSTSYFDVHQDHRTLAKCVLKAFNRLSILHYEVFNSSINFQPTLFMPLTEADLAAKMEAISIYKTQLDPEASLTDYFSPEIVRTSAMQYGLKVGSKYAEPFLPIRFRMI